MRALQARQLERLRSTLRVVRGANPFWTPRLAAAGLDEGIGGLDELRRLPLLTKAELAADQNTHPPLGTNRSYPLEDYVRMHRTSSTTGRPLTWLDTRESWSSMVEIWREVLVGAGVTAADRALFAFSFGPFIGFWLGFEAAQRIGCLTLSGGALDGRGRLGLLEEHEVSLLCCTPTYALHLAEIAEREGVDLARLHVRRLAVAGEPGGALPAVRARLEAAWPGARIFDHYGMTEVGPVTFQCEAVSDHVHVLEESYVAEVIDPESGRAIGNETSEQERMGELVVTTLDRAAAPVLRYRTGDLVRALPDASCACGRRGMILLGGILARADHMEVVRGVNVFPSAVDEVLRRDPQVAEYQVEIDTRKPLTEVRVRVEARADCPDPRALAERLERALRATFSLRIPVELAKTSSLPRFELKARRWNRIT
jgi:phenylacetate-CoA ligase